MLQIVSRQQLVSDSSGVSPTCYAESWRQVGNKLATSCGLVASTIATSRVSYGETVWSRGVWPLAGCREGVRVRSGQCSPVIIRRPVDGRDGCCCCWCGCGRRPAASPPSDSEGSSVSWPMSRPPSSSSSWATRTTRRSLASRPTTSRRNGAPRRTTAGDTAAIEVIGDAVARKLAKFSKNSLIKIII